MPRHLFLPRFFGLTPDGTANRAIDERHPHWLELAYRNAVWPTQLDADPTAWHRAAEHGPITGTPTLVDLGLPADRPGRGTDGGQRPGRA